MLHGRFVHVGKTLTDLQILGCKLYQNVFGGWAIALPSPPDPVAVIRGGEGGRKGLGIGRERKV